MIFVLSVFVAYFLAVPGMYLLARARLANSLIEVLSLGFFCGFGLVVLTYLGLGWHMRAPITDVVVVGISSISAILLFFELKKNPLPFWPGVDKLQILVVSVAFIFMALLAFGDLAKYIDDDLFIHLPNIKRIEMGDIPPHVPYFPEMYLRGHTGRDIFIGSVGRLLNLTPELSIIYVTLAVVPVYVLAFFAFASRLAGGRRISSCFCFYGLMFLVSCAAGNHEIRAGAATYVYNNNIFAYSYAVFICWLVDAICRQFSFEENGLLKALARNRLAIAICVLSYTALYSIYLSNLLMISLFLATLPVFIAVISRAKKIRNAIWTSAVLAVVVSGSVALHLISSPFLLERVMVTLKLKHLDEPVGMTQQATLTFPRSNPFYITEPSGTDIPFLAPESLGTQGLSFFLGVSGILVGLLVRRPAIAATSLFGWLVYLWMMLVDMGQYKAETLRLMLVGNIGFGASAGLILGYCLEQLLEWLKKTENSGRINQWGRTIAATASVVVVVSLGAWMGRGNMEKFIVARHWDVRTAAKDMVKIHRQNPEDWHPGLNMARVDRLTFSTLAQLIKNPSDRLMIKVSPDERFLGTHHPVNRIAPIINAATITGAGIVGTTQEHCKPNMSLELFPFDYRASLFWHKPTQALLNQISPDWIVVDPSLVSDKVLTQVLALPGIAQVESLSDQEGRKRLILRYTKLVKQDPAPSNVTSVALVTHSTETSRYGLVNVPINLVRSNSQTPHLELAVEDEEAKPVNTSDTPYIPLTHDQGDRWVAHFSMVQSGRWNVYFLDPTTHARLNDSPLKVNVDQAIAIRHQR